MTEEKPVFEAEVGSRVMVEPAGVGEHFTSEFLGWERGRYIMLKLPPKLAASENLYLEKPVVVKYLHSGGRVYAFRSTILALAHVPFRILFLRYPEGLEVMSLRKQDRVDCFVPVILAAENETWEGAMLNLSASGGRIVLDSKEGRPLPKTDGVFGLRFRLVSREVEEYALSAKIMKAAVEGGRAVLVVSFVDTPQKIQEQLGRYVEAVASYLGAGGTPAGK